MTEFEEEKELKEKLKEARASASGWKHAHREKSRELERIIAEQKLDKAETVARIYFQCFEMVLNVRQAEVTHKFVKEQK